MFKYLENPNWIISFLLTALFPIWFMAKSFVFTSSPLGGTTGAAILVTVIAQVFWNLCIMVDSANTRFLFSFMLLLLIAILVMGMAAMIIEKISLGGSCFLWTLSWLSTLVILLTHHSKMKKILSATETARIDRCDLIA